MNYKIMRTGILIILIAVTTLTACRQVPYTQIDQYIYVQKIPRADANWQLIWEDSFDGPEIDTTKWTRIPSGEADWNRHMSSDDRCYSLTDGHLILKGIANPDTLSDPRPFITGGLYTKGKFAFQYGKIEIHAKLECAQGAWPAMWMLAEQKKNGAYPRNGEIDIMEHLNYDDLIYQTTHSYYTLELKEKENPPHGGTAPIDISQFNTFGLEWTPDNLIFTLNGDETFRYPRVPDVDSSQWPYDQPFFVLIDQQLGGSWVGEVDLNALPVQMMVDWVKVYQ